MINNYKKQDGERIPTCVPKHSAPSHPEPTVLPDDHPCHNCPVIDMSSSVPYCFLPGCLRKEFEKPGDTS